MSEPEIARRCHDCGASIRDRAFFCPQCGTSLLDETKALESPGPKVKPREESNRETKASNAPMLEAPTMPLQRPGGIAMGHGSRVKTDPTPVKPRDGRVVQRVEKLRKISTVVLDQAAYDPSLRFLLVAAVLFLVFLIILIMSKLIS